MEPSRIRLKSPDRRLAAMWRRHTTWEQLVVRGRLDAGGYVACYINDGRIDAAVGLNRAKDIRRIVPLIRSRVNVDLDRLQNESIDLRSLQPGS